VNTDCTDIYLKFVLELFDILKYVFYAFSIIDASAHVSQNANSIIGEIFSQIRNIGLDVSFVRSSCQQILNFFS
jgi:hypothetical protein